MVNHKMAGLFPEEVLAEVRSRSDIVDVVSAYVTLKRKGTKYWGLCPFHNEKTPSFSISPDKQFYYCFGCHTGGSVFHFIMNMEHLSFAESVEFLAARAGITVARTQEDAAYREKAKKKERLYEVNRLAARFYHSMLMDAHGDHAREYLKNRGVGEKTIQRFGLGFAPDARDTLAEALKTQGCSKDELMDAGLIVRNKDRPYDYFRNRVMFPIMDALGNVVGFGGRLMQEGQPKYLNSPETEVFNKRRNLYGISNLKRLKAAECAVVVEGYMDVIALSAKGVEGAVASLGTAFTREQARLLKRYAKSAAIAYDGDAAGQNAAQKALDVFAMEGLPVRVVRMPEGMDPDDLVSKQGADAFLQALGGAQEPADFRLDLIKARKDLRVQKGRVEYAIEGAKVVAQLGSPAEQAAYIMRLQKETGFDKDTLRRQVEMGGAIEHNEAAGKNRLGNYRNNKTSEAAERELLSCMVQSGDCARLAKQMLSLDDFSDERHLEIARLLWYALENVQSAPDVAALLDALPDEGLTAYAAEVFGSAEKPADQDSLKQNTKECCIRIRRQSIEKKVKELQHQFTVPGTGKETRKEILSQIQELNREFQSLQD
ncbi:MAG: DNA primase [Bacillota bacterium]